MPRVHAPTATTSTGHRYYGWCPIQKQRFNVLSAHRRWQKGLTVQTYGIVSLILLLVIGLGAFKVWRILVRVFSRPFQTPNLAKIKKVAFLIVALTVVSMLTPFLLPFNSTIRLVIYAAYALYAVLGLSQIWDWLNGLLNRNKTPGS